jgi:hypothetical protein
MVLDKNSKMPSGQQRQQGRSGGAGGCKRRQAAGLHPQGQEPVKGCMFLRAKG